MFTECRTQIFLHFCHFMFNFKRNMWSRIGRYVSSWHVICTWKCVLNTNSVASNPISLTPCNKAVCSEASPQIKMSFSQVHWIPMQALFIKLHHSSVQQSTCGVVIQSRGLRVPDATRQGNVMDSSHFAKAGWASRAALFYGSCSETEGKPNESHMAEQITVRVANVPQSGKHNLYLI